MTTCNTTLSYLTSVESIALEKKVGNKTSIHGILIAVFIICLWAISLVCLLSLNVAQLPSWLILLAMLWQAFLYTGLFITAHDAMHGSVFPQNPKINTFVGRVAVLAYGFLSYRKLLQKHWLHHKHPASEFDPDFHNGINKNPIAWYFHFMKGYWDWRQLIGLSLIYNAANFTLPVCEANLILFWVIPPLLSSVQLFYLGTFLTHKEPKGGYTDPHRTQTNPLPIALSFITFYHFGYHEEHHEYPFVCVSCGQAIQRRADAPPFFMPWSYENTWPARLRNQVAYTILDRSCQPILQAINRYRQQWKLPPYRHIYASNARLAHISQQPAAFDFPYPNLPKHLHYVGPLRNRSPRSVSFPFDRLTGQPLIYASLGSVQNTKQGVFRCIAEACKGLDVQLVIAHGGGMSADAAQEMPGFPLVVDYAPQLEVIAKASLTITHGGLNTVLDSLSHGVPLVAMPITFEQPGNGARIRWTGTGEVMSISQVSVSKLQAAIQRVLTEESYRHNARRIQEAIAQAGGVIRAADIIEQVITAQSPILSASASRRRA